MKMTNWSRSKENIQKFPKVITSKNLISFTISGDAANNV